MKSFAILLACAGAIASAQDLTKPIDYTTRAKPTADILIDLTKQSGVNLICTPDLENEPLILKFHHIPLKDAMDKIAFVFAGEWKKHENGYQLQRSDEAEKLHQQSIAADAADYVEGVKEAMQRLDMGSAYSADDANTEIRKVLELMAQQTPNMQAWVGLHDHDPSVRFVLRILEKIDPKQVVDLPSTPRIFSDKPTSLELQLPDIGDAIKKFDEEQQVLDDAVDHMPDLTQQQVDNLHLVLASRSSNAIDRVVVMLSGGRGRYNAGIWIVDANGKIIMNGGVDINGKADEAANAQELAKIARAKKTSVPLGKIALDMLPNVGDHENFRRVSAETKAVLLEPTKTDPLAIATSDAVLGFADADNVNVAFLPPDDADAWCYQIGRTGKVSLDAFEQQAAFSKELDVSEENGWLVGAPLDPLETARQRLSRSAMEEYLNAAGTKLMDVDRLAKFEADARPDSNKVLLTDTLNALYNADFYDLLPEGNVGAEPSLALLGTLSDQQRAKAQQGGLKLVPGELSEQQIEYLHEWLLAYGAHFTPAGPDVDMTEADKFLDGQGMPTEVMGDGPPPGSYLHVLDQTALPFYDIKASADAKRASYGSDLAGLAWNAAKLERPDLFAEGDLHTLDYLSVGSERKLTMRFVVGNRAERCDFVEDHNPPKDAPSISLAEALQRLTPELRGQYNTYLALCRARFAKQKPLPAEGTKPPRS